ncbi:N-acetyltransferase [Formosa sediminum]|uniref:N-acetyltransferase n=1 Tax=Formosa sediminum TaxID=2594004 RepID=A0A516GM51_9FLAO|nr:GNAT family N-acetyltransferase [Formosa sediminum]QDO92587.1 N-acetyltransferase [Formosa sediminum]
MNIRFAEIKDVSKIVEIVNYEILNSTVIYDYNERTYQYQLNWFHQKCKDNMPVIVAEEYGEVLGFGTYGIFRPWEAYKFSVEHSIYVSREARAKGIGKKLLTELISIAKANNFHTMIAGVDASNAGSIAFHKKFGFVEIGVFKEVGYKFNTWLDLNFMQLILKE